MLAAYVQARKTPLAFEAAAAAMRAALAQKLGGQPSVPVLALALAKTAFETARWQSIWNDNWGNVKAGETYAGSYCCYSCNEFIESEVKWFIPEGELDRKGGIVVGKVWLVPPGHPQTRFRSYSSATEGASRYVEFVAGGRYESAWELLLLGDAAGYVRELKAKGYFTGDETTYARGVVALKDEFSSKLARLPAGEVSVPERDDVRPLLAPDPDMLLYVEATRIATEARFDDLDRLRRDALAEITGHGDDESSDEPDA
ncbi:MAG TPA: hypothetical protein VF103_14115 [Polyangiaceae bacterium]